MIYFNEIDPFCAQWIRRAFIGEVDERDIRTIERPALAVRQHYFAGIGGWEYALELADWPDDREVWTGSCPCQPFSVAGKREAHEDERDLWPAFFRLIAIGRPAVVLGEQVNGAITHGWLDRICDDLEGIGYAVGAAVLPACGVGAPHIRQRLYWMAVAQSSERGPVGIDRADGCDGPDTGREEAHGATRTRREVRGVAHAEERGQRIHRGASRDPGHAELSLEAGGLGDPNGGRRQERDSEVGNVQGHQSNQNGRVRLADTDSAAGARYGEYGRSRSSQPEPESHWTASGSLYCSDGRWRRVPLEPSFQPLADSGRFGNPRADSNLSSRIGALKGSGNAIVIPLAAEFIRAVMETLDKRW